MAFNVDGQNLLAITNPAHHESRMNMTMTISEDQGVNWSRNITIFSSHAAYSDLVALDNGDILVLYEAGYKNAYEGIHYQIISKPMLTAQAALNAHLY